MYFCRCQSVGNSETGKLCKCMQQKVWFIDRLTVSYNCMQHSGCLCVASMPAIDMHYMICCPTFPAVSDGGPIVTLSLFSGAYFGSCWMDTWGEAGQLESMHAHWETVHWGLRLICITLSVVYFILLSSWHGAKPRTLNRTSISVRTEIQTGSVRFVRLIYIYFEAGISSLQGTWASAAWVLSISC